MITVILAEKPSQALAYAAAFKESVKHEGYFEISDPIFGVNKTYITFGFGHLVELAEPGTEETAESTIPGKSDLGTKTTAESVNPTDETPVETEYGNIVGTNNGNVTLKTNDGSTKIVPTNVVGGTIQNDGTIKIKSTDGKMKVLPKAGMEDHSVLLSLIGILMVGMGIVLKKRI